jgi:hypothetical protein
MRRVGGGLVAASPTGCIWSDRGRGAPSRMRRVGDVPRRHLLRRRRGRNVFCAAFCHAPPRRIKPPRHPQRSPPPPAPHTSRGCTQVARGFREGASPTPVAPHTARGGGRDQIPQTSRRSHPSRPHDHGGGRDQTPTNPSPKPPSMPHPRMRAPSHPAVRRPGSWPLYTTLFEQNRLTITVAAPPAPARRPWPLTRPGSRSSRRRRPRCDGTGR